MMLHQEKDLPNDSGRPFSYNNFTDKKQNDYYRVFKNVLYPKMQNSKNLFITIKTIEFGMLIYLSDRTVLLAFWRIMNEGNRPNKTKNA